MRRCPSSSARISPGEIRLLRPDIPIVLMSGYSSAPLDERGARSRNPGRSCAKAATEEGHRGVSRARYALTRSALFIQVRSRCACPRPRRHRLGLGGRIGRRWLRTTAIWRATMRSFLAACCASLAIAVIAAVILDSAVQESATTAFSTSEVRALGSPVLRSP